MCTNNLRKYKSCKMALWEPTAPIKSKMGESKSKAKCVLRCSTKLVQKGGLLPNKSRVIRNRTRLLQLEKFVPGAIPSKLS